MSELRAWVEIDLAQWRRNLAIINQNKPAALRIAAVLKDDAYGHGAFRGAQISLEAGAAMIAVVTLDEALELRNKGIQSQILLLGQRLGDELDTCLQASLTCCLHDFEIAEALSKKAAAKGVKARVHVEIDSGMSRYGARWTEAISLIPKIAALPFIDLEGVMSHFAMSDELDKTFANLQRARFQEILDGLAARGIVPKIRHLSNSGGFLDLPQAHYDMARLGILPLGVYPSQVCRRLDGIEPVMTVKARIVHIQKLEAGDKVGYGLRYTAPGPRRIAVLPVGYGDGFPRVRNEGSVLIAGKRAPIVGGASMDAITVDITEIPEANLWGEATLMGRSGAEEITVHDIAALKKSVSYDALTSWRHRMRRVYLDGGRSA